MTIPSDPIILLSYVNTQLRDFYINLDDMCKSLSIDQTELVEKLNKINYQYDESRNQFV